MPASRYSYDTLSSTNAKAWELIGRGIDPPFYVVAREQTAGRGQRGHTWLSPPGGLYLTYAIALDWKIDCAPHLMLLAAWGIADSFRRRQIPVQIKWLNDLILHGGKLGGIKTEIRSSQGQLRAAIVGVGINACNPVPPKGINLKAEISPIVLPVLESWAVGGIERGLDRYRAAGIDPILRDYQRLLLNLGKEIAVKGIKGTIAGVTAQGHLRVRLQSPGASAEACFPPGSIQLGYG